MTIPRILHQTYASLAELPTELHENRERIRALNPGWTLKFYDDDAVEAYIAKHYEANILALYQRINPRYGAVRADLFRYLLMYREGGVYLDIKSAMDRPLDDVLLSNERYVLSFWPPAQGEPHKFWGNHPELLSHDLGEFQQWHLIAAPGHMFLKAVINNVLTNIMRYRVSSHGVGRTGVLRISGPIAYTLAITPLLHKAPHRMVANHWEIGLRYSVLKQHGTNLRPHYSTLSEPIVIHP